MELKLLKKPLFWLLLLAALVWTAVWQLPDNQLHLIFCDVGQGDAILITYQNQQVLIDGGPNNEVLTCLADHLPFWDRKIEAVIATHPDADHITGLVEVIQRYDIGQFIINAVAKDSAVFREFQQAILAEETATHQAQAGEKIRLGPAQLAVLWPAEVLPADYSGDTNEASIVLRLSLGEFDALLTGDIGFETETQISPGEVEVLKVAHHGSQYATGEAFLEEVSPELAVISVGKNSFGHPTAELLGRLNNQGVEVLRTDQAGEIEVITNGKTWRVN